MAAVEKEELDELLAERIDPNGPRSEVRGALLSWLQERTLEHDRAGEDDPLLLKSQIEKLIDEMITEHIDSLHANLATKEDLAALEEQVENNSAWVATLPAKLDEKIKDHERDLHGGVLGGSGGGGPAKQAGGAAWVPDVELALDFSQPMFVGANKWTAPKGVGANGQDITLSQLPGPQSPLTYPPSDYQPGSPSRPGVVLGTQADYCTWISEDMSNIVVNNRTDIVGGQKWMIHANGLLNVQVGGDMKRLIVGHDVKRVLGEKHEDVEQSVYSVFKSDYTSFLKGTRIEVEGYTQWTTIGFRKDTCLGACLTTTGGIAIDIKKAKVYQLGRQGSIEKVENLTELAGAVRRDAHQLYQRARDGMVLKATNTFRLNAPEIHEKCKNAKRDGECITTLAKRFLLDCDKAQLEAKKTISAKAKSITEDCKTFKVGNGTLAVKS